MTDRLKDMNSRNRLNELMASHLEGRLTPTEKLELMGLWLEPSLQPELTRLVEAAWEGTGEAEGLTEDALKMLFQKAFEEHHEAQIIPMTAKRSPWKRWTVAASIALIVGLGGYLLWPLTDKEDIVVTETKVNYDVQAPATAKATITLVDGKKMYLDSMNSGILAKQGNIKLVKLADGQIAYQSITGEPIKEIQYNTLSNPRGSKVIDMALTDGSHVWLNAGSSITYPIVFAGNERKVQITGEAYFDVTHNPAMPFKVTKGKMEITVLGTHFNVNTYEDESDIRVTLLEGSVNVSNGSSKALLKPGQQARITSEINLVNNVDIDLVMAWKDGMFVMKSADIETIMRQIARWYDVDVKYENGTPKGTITGEVPRTFSLSEVLKVYEYSGVRFRIDGKKVIVVK